MCACVSICGHFVQESAQTGAAMDLASGRLEFTLRFLVAVPPMLIFAVLVDFNDVFQVLVNGIEQLRAFFGAHVFRLAA